MTAAVVGIGKAEGGERWAAIDIGSDTIHLLVADIVDHHGVPTVQRREGRAQLLGLGLDVARFGEIQPRTARRLTKTLARYVGAALSETDHLIIGATEATRRATNGPELLEALAGTAARPIHQLSGEREAHLGFLACRHRLDTDAMQLLIDSGGASTEVTVTDGLAVVGAISLPVGASLLAARLHDDPPRALPWALLASELGTALSGLPDVHPSIAWATGGTAHNLAQLRRRSGKRVLVRTLSMSDLDDLSAELLRAPAKRLARASGESPLRIRLLPPGALILASILQRYGLDGCSVVPEGVRDGMLLAATRYGEDWWRDQAE